jgi:queuine tRNA-ribosyltransferase
MRQVLEWSVPALHEDKPRHLLGIGEPEDLFDGVERGIDLFDCVAPTRHARHGQIYTPTGRVNITNATFREDFAPIDPECPCYTCAEFTRAYLRHLFVAGELLAYRLTTLHNLTFVLGLMRRIRAAIRDGALRELRAEFLARWRAGDGPD